jgi:hypothetical protein
MGGYWTDGDLAAVERLAYLIDDEARRREALRGGHVAAEVQRVAEHLGVDLAFLADALQSLPSSPPPSVLAQIGALEDRLGLSPAGRRRLGWVVAQADGGEAQVLTLAPRRAGGAVAIYERATGREPVPPDQPHE